MARPKLGSSDTERLHVKITADEIATIDDWRYANRVPSRSEAVRRLVQIGLRTTQALLPLAKEIGSVLDLAAEATDIPEAVIAESDPNATTSEVDKAIAVRLFDAVQDVFNAQIEAQNTYHRLLAELAPFITEADYELARSRADYVATSEALHAIDLADMAETRREHVERWKQRRQAIYAKQRERRK